MSVVLCLSRAKLGQSLFSEIFREEVCVDISRLSYVYKDDKNVT